MIILSVKELKKYYNNGEVLVKALDVLICLWNREALLL